jgi:anaerobic ribonucleoside-triphosphate reductase activating protein
VLWVIIDRLPLSTRASNQNIRIDSSLMSQKRKTEQLCIAGITPLTTIDFPGELAAVIFLQGCAWRCGYCQNSELLTRTEAGNHDWDETLEWLQGRTGLLDAVVFSGGEPTLHKGLKKAVQQVKALGYRVGLHTAGIYPERFSELLPLLDWVGLDIKSACQDYETITGVKGSGDRAWKSARYLIKSGVEHEFRTTLHPDMLSPYQLFRLQDELVRVGAQHVVMQECVLENCLDENRRQSHTRKPEAHFLQQIGKPFKRFEVRKA